MARRYDKEFKLHVVKQVVELNKTAAQVTTELGVSKSGYYTLLKRSVSKQKKAS